MINNEIANEIEKANEIQTGSTTSFGDIYKGMIENVKKAIEEVSKEKDIDLDYLFESMELALNSAYKKNYRLPNSRVEINRDTGDIKIYSFKREGR